MSTSLLMAYQAELLEEWMCLERLNPECKAGAPATQDTKQWESSHLRHWLLTLPTKRKGIPRMQSPHGRDWQHLGFSAMSSPKFTTFVPPLAKKQRMSSLGREIVLSCVQASLASPQHTLFHGLLTAIPQVWVLRMQPPKECGLTSPSTSSQVYCYKALQPLGSQQIKYPLSHPGSCRGRRETKI